MGERYQSVHHPTSPFLYVELFCFFGNLVKPISSNSNNSRLHVFAPFLEHMNAVPLLGFGWIFLAGKKKPILGFCLLMVSLDRIRFW